jgi:hypothetical protein
MFCYPVNQVSAISNDNYGPMLSAFIDRGLWHHLMQDSEEREGEGETQESAVGEQWMSVKWEILLQPIQAQFLCDE